MPLDRVIKRDGTVVPFDRVRIENAIYAAARAVGNGEGRPWAETLSWAVTGLVEERFGGNGHLPHVEEIQDVVEEILIKSGNPRVAKGYLRNHEAEAKSLRKSLGDTMLADWAAHVQDFEGTGAWRYLPYLDGLLEEAAEPR